MSVSSLVVAAHGNQFFDQLPDDVVKLSFEFLAVKDGSLSIDHLFMRRAADRNISHNDVEADDRTVVATSAVCRNYRDNVVLQKVRQEASTRLRQRAHLQNAHREFQQLNEYPSKMVRVFRNSRFPILQLPVLALGNRNGRTGYIDFIQPADMSHPVMRFRDLQGRPGIALNIRASRRILYSQEFDGLDQLFLGQRVFSFLSLLARKSEELGQRLFTDDGPNVVLVLFKRYLEPTSNTWVYAWGNNDGTIERLYNVRHENNGHVGPRISACPNCPFIRRTINKTLLLNLLNGRDPDFWLPGHNTAQLRNRAAARNYGISQRTVIVTALAVVAIAFLVNHYLASREALPNQ